MIPLRSTHRGDVLAIEGVIAEGEVALAGLGVDEPLVGARFAAYCTAYIFFCNAWSLPRAPSITSIEIST
jgi:hypothetical protein